MQKYILITGGTKGIGRATVERFAREGFHIITCARHEKDLKKLKMDIQQEYTFSEVHYQAVDVSSKAGVDRFVEFVRELNVPIEVLVNNAGIFIPGKIHEEPAMALQHMLEANLYSAYYLSKGLIPDMIKRRNGHIFNMCSTASIMAYPNGGSYCISKFALYGMTKVLREEMKEYGIRVTAILPGATLTASWEGVDLPPERFMKSEDVAHAIFTAYSLSPHSVMEEILIRPQLGDL